MNDVLFQIILLLIPVLATVVTGYVLPLITTKIGAEKLSTIVRWVTYAVKAAEMLYSEEKMGVVKKQYVIDFINGLFNKKKVVITEEQINVLIESVVEEMNKDKK